jgi:hypothetical protein
MYCMRDSLRFIPIIIDWAKKAASYVVTNATILLDMGRQTFYSVVTAVDPFCNCYFKTACVITTRISSAGLQLNSSCD